MPIDYRLAFKLESEAVEGDNYEFFAQLLTSAFK